MRKWRTLVGLCLLGLAGIACAERKPNILFILADDLGMQDVGFMGSQYFETPNLDALADQSLVFNQTYMYPTCSPSGAAILTGQQSFRTGCYGDFSWLAAHKTPEIQQYYPTGRGFDENVGGTWWGDPARGHDKGYNAPGGGYAAPFKNPFIPKKKDDEWLTDRLTSEAIDFMERHKDGPFFVSLDFYAPHRPSVPRNERWMAHFMQKEGDPSTGQGMGSAKKKGEIAAYATMVKSIDENVQRIVDYLDRTGLRENTVIIFTSDNGSNGLQSHTENLRGAKGYVYEGGIRVPALINWPKTVAPGRCDEPIQGLDFFPTFLELAGISDYEGTLDGDSLVPLMRGKPLKERALFLQVASTYKDPPCSIIRKGNWKLIQFLKEGNIELYNLREDLKESHDLATGNPEKAQALFKELTGWRRANKVPLPPGSRLEF